MSANNKKVEVALEAPLHLNEKVFVRLMRDSKIIFSILKAYTFIQNGLTDIGSIKVDNVLIDVEKDENAILIKNIRTLKNTSNEKYQIHLTNHVFEQVFERKLKYFDWSILLNVYRNVLKDDHIKNLDYEVCNTRSTAIYAVNNNVISIISAWSGSRVKK